VVFTLEHVFDREDVLALEAAVLVIGATAMRLLAQPNGIAPFRRLAWDGPRVAFPQDFGCRCDFEAL
jgi:hypothetical protein